MQFFVLWCVISDQTSHYIHIFPAATVKTDSRMFLVTFGISSLGFFPADSEQCGMTFASTLEHHIRIALYTNIHANSLVT